MTDMTATEIAAAVAELTEAIRAKGYTNPVISIGIERRNNEFYWDAYAHCYSGEASLVDIDDLHDLRFDTVGFALDAIRSEIDKLPKITPEHQAAEAFRAALSDAREARVDDQLAASINYREEIDQLRTDAIKDKSRVKELEGALSRQADNIAFLLNRVTIPDQWFSKFDAELGEDRAALKGGAE